MKKIWILYITFLLLLPLYSFSANRSAPEWMNYTIGARAVALGQNFAAFADDATAAFNNPGGLPNIFSEDYPGHMFWVSGTFAILPYDRWMGAFTTSFKLNGLILGVSGLFTQGKNQVDSGFGQGDTEKDNAWLAQITLASSLAENQSISFGGNIKFFQDTSDNVKGNGLVFDFGAYIAVFNMISVGAFVKNIGFVKYEGREARFVAPVVSVGVGYNPLSRRNFAFCLHIERETGKDNKTFKGSGGLFVAVYSNEYMSESRKQNPVDEIAATQTKRVIYYNTIHLNFGFHGYEFSCGTTFNFFGFKFDYAFTFEIKTGQENQYSHIFTLEKRF